MHDLQSAPATPRPSVRSLLQRLPVRPPLVDVALAAAFVLMTVAEAVLSPAVPSPGLHAVVGGLAMATLGWRRTFPIGVAVCVVVSTIVTNPDGQFSTLLSLVLVCYTVGSETETPRSYAGLAVVAVPFLVALTALNPQGLQPSDVAAAVVFLLGPWAVGVLVRQRGLRTEEAVARAELLERERAVAVEQERTRIARELHDIVSHSITVVTIQTQAVRRRLGPEHAREAADLAAVEATAREALAEMRRLFGVLRADGEAASLVPQPGLAELDRLLRQVRAPQLEVELTVDGEPFDLAPGVDLAAYRIVQEGLTNAVRHSGARRVDVVVSYRLGSIGLVIEDDGRGMTDATGGHGLVGLRERVAIYGGSLQIGHRVAGGVRLEAHLPVGEAT